MTTAPDVRALLINTALIDDLKIVAKTAPALASVATNVADGTKGDKDKPIALATSLLAIVAILLTTFFGKDWGLQAASPALAVPIAAGLSAIVYAVRVWRGERKDQRAHDLQLAAQSLLNASLAAVETHPTKPAASVASNAQLTTPVSETGALTAASSTATAPAAYVPTYGVSAQTPPAQPVASAPTPLVTAPTAQVPQGLGAAGSLPSQTPSAAFSASVTPEPTLTTPETAPHPVAAAGDPTVTQPHQVTAAGSTIPSGPHVVGGAVGAQATYGG